MVKILTFNNFNESYKDTSFGEFMNSLNIDDDKTLEISSIVNPKLNIRSQLEKDLSKIQKKYESSFQPDSYASIDEMYSALDRMYQKI